jgi:hypothetical protein
MVGWSICAAEILNCACPKWVSTEMAALAFDVGFTLNIRHSFDSSARRFRADFVEKIAG